MLVGDWQLWDEGEVAAAVEPSSCGDMGLTAWLESTGLGRDKRERDFNNNTNKYNFKLKKRSNEKSPSHFLTHIDFAL